MNGHITSEAVVAYSQCVRKAFFILHGESRGNQHELERVLNERASENRETYTTELAHNQLDSIPGSIRAVSGEVVHAEDLAATCDALHKVAPDSGRFHARYEPHLVLGTYGVSSEQKLALAFSGYVLGEIKRYRPVNNEEDFRSLW